MFEDRLKKLRLARGLSQQETADALGLKVNTYRNYENNEREPNSTVLIKLGKYFGVTLDYLLDYHCDKRQENIRKENNFTNKEEQFINKYRTLDEHGQRIINLTLNEEYERCRYIEKPPVIELPFSLLKASAGSGDWLDDEQFDTISVQDKPEARKADIVIEVDGDSMLPEYANGDKVFVRLQPSIFENEIGIFIVNGSGFIKKMGKGELISTNPEFENIPINNYTVLKCVGKVIGKV